MPRERLDDEIEGDVPPPSHIDAMVLEMNKDFFVVNHHGKVLVYHERFDANNQKTAYDTLKFEDFRNLFKNKKILDADQKPKSIGEIWINHPARRQYPGGIRFEPEKTVPDNALNLWRGFSVKPAKGSWDKLLWHIEHVICGGDKEAFKYAIGWMAYLIQHPGRQAEVAFVMKGKEGTGKSIFAGALAHLLHHHSLHVSSPEQLTGRFNINLFNSVFVFADEAYFAGDPSQAAPLKRLITEKTLMIEAKFQGAFEAPNYIHLMMASNDRWVVPASLEARRFFVVEVSDEKRGDAAYFDAIMDELRNGGYEAMLDFLQSLDLSNFNIRKVPQTDGLQDQKMQSLGLEHSWWLDVLQRGYVYESKYALEAFNDWWPEVATDLLYKSYEAYAVKNQGRRKRMNREMFGKFLGQELGAERCKPRRLLTGETIAPGREAEAVWGRKPAYRIGTLTQARESFVSRTGLKQNWEEDTTITTRADEKSHIVSLRERLGGR